MATTGINTRGEFSNVRANELGPVFAVAVSDNSMTMASGISFPRGDTLVFNPDAKIEPGDFCLAEVQAEPLPVFRRYMEEEPGVIRLEPLSAAHKTYWIKQGSPGRILARLMLRIEEF